MKRLRSTWLHVVMVLVMFLSTSFVFQGKTAYAAASAVTINKVDYENENVIVNNNSNTKIYFATELNAAKDNWEVLNADSGATTEIDFSWLASGSDNVLVFRGEEDITKVRVTIVKRTRKLDVSINYSDLADLSSTDTIAPLLNIMTTSGTGEEPIVFTDLEWKKGEEGKWTDCDTLTVAQLEKYQIMGTDLFFRIIADNDDATDVAADPINHPYPNGTKGRRVSSDVRLKIEKKAAASTIGVDGGKFIAALRKGKEYRVTINNVTSNWTQVDDLYTTSVKLEKIVNDGSDGITKAFPKMILEFRDYATSSKAASKITKIPLIAQRALSGIIVDDTVPANPTTSEANDIYVNYNGITNLIITIPKASTALPYEFYIQKSGTTFNLQNAVWTTITRSTGVKVIAAKAADGDILHIRQKLIKTSSVFELASTEAKDENNNIGYTIAYPSVPVITKQTIVFTKGYSGSKTFDAVLNTAGRLPFETKITSIKLGTKELGFSYTVAPTLPNPVDKTKSYTMTVTLLKDSLESMVNCTARALTITYENGTVNKTSLKLTIQNPTVAGQLTTSTAPGTATGTTAVTVSSYVTSGNSLVYTIGTTEVTGKNTVDTMTTGNPFTSGTNITITANSYLTVYEIDSNSFIVKYKSINVTSGMIK